LVYVDPDGFDATATQKSYLSTHANQVTTALRQANGIHPTTDADRDGLNAFAEYAYGTDDLVADGSILTTNVDANGRFNISFPKNLAADDALVVVEVSTDMSTWTVAGDALELGTETHNGDGTSTFTLRTPNAAAGEAKFFVRLRVYER
jgi:hypothetical protein